MPLPRRGRPPAGGDPGPHSPPFSFLHADAGRTPPLQSVVPCPLLKVSRVVAAALFPASPFPSRATASTPDPHLDLPSGAGDWIAAPRIGIKATASIDRPSSLLAVSPCCRTPRTSPPTTGAPSPLWNVTAEAAPSTLSVDPLALLARPTPHASHAGRAAAP
jgi:hypothetical protein